MALNLIRLYEICKDGDELVRKLQEWKLIPGDGEYRCPKCQGVLKLTMDSNRLDGRSWFCGNFWRRFAGRKRERCVFRATLRTGTFFARSKLALFQVLGFAHLWCEGAALVFIAKQLDISRPSAVDWASFCREVVFDAYVAKPEKLGGPGKIVEIDESKFGKRKYHRGRAVEGQWVFGGYERGTGRVFMVAVEHRGVETLLPIIREWVADGTTIVSDYWRAYDCLGAEGYEHLRVNHSLHFKDPETGAHTNAIESSWRAAKATMSSSGRRKAHIPGNLARYIFHKSCRERGVDRTEEFFRLAGGLYSPSSPADDFMGELPEEDLYGADEDVAMD